MRLEVRRTSAEDMELSFAITEQAMREHVEATWGVWDRGVQRKAHTESFSPATHWIVLANDREVGVVAAANESSHVQLVKLYLCSGARSHGIGSMVLRSILRFGASHAKPVRLRVLSVNQRAQAFYMRHGFREAFRTVERVFMEARPGSSSFQSASPRKDDA
jgi:ribosomal protein S18 acetylase RimI-like enzyme